MIPKKIHYCWFGKKPLPADVKKCINSWKKACPDYEIVRWDETNFNINSCDFVKKAYENEKWAFVSDYARLKIIYDQGGIYLDTDVELVKSLDDLRNKNCYFAVQQDGNYINTGLGFGAKKHHKVIKEMLDKYKNLVFDINKLEDLACPFLNTAVLEEKGYSVTDKVLYLKDADVYIYPPKYFDPLAPGNTQNLLCNDTYSIHHYSATWTSKSNVIKRKIINFIGQDKIHKLKKIRNMNRQEKEKLAMHFMNFIILFAFLMPRGYLEYSTIYKSIYKCLIWASVLCIWIQFFIYDYKAIKSENHIKIALYFIFLIIITILIRGFKINGLQKLFAYPSILLFTINNFKRNPKEFLNTIINIFIFNLLCNQILTCRYFTDSFHITYLGHVQMAAQYTVLASFCLLIDNVLLRKNVKKNTFLMFLIFITLITTDAATSLVSLAIILIIWLLYKLKLTDILEYDTKIYFILISILSIITIFTSIGLYKFIHPLNFSGRSFIWKDAIGKIVLSPLFGYGVEGIMITPFWSLLENSLGFNYAHNQLLQNFLDGGIIGSALYYVMVLTIIENVKSIKNKRIVLIINSAIIIYSLIMIFESASLYCYMYILFGMIYSLSYLRRGEYYVKNKSS